MEDIDDYRCKYNHYTNELDLLLNDDEIIEINDLISKCVTEDIATEILKYLLEDINSKDLEEPVHNNIFYVLNMQRCKKDCILNI